MKFLISPGLARSGTTYLNFQLVVLNRELFNVPFGKETNVFWANQPLEDLLSEKFKSRDPEKYFVDFSPSYLAGSIRAVERIANLAKSHEVKLVIHLRNPVDQAYAHYVHDVAAHVCRLEFGENANYPFWAEKALNRYLVPRAPLIRRLVEAVGLENILVVNFHRDIPDAAGLTRKLAGFLGLDLKPFSSGKVGAGGWLPYYVCAADEPVEFAQGDEVRLVPPRHVLLVNGELSRIWQDVQEDFASMLARGQSSWTRNLDEHQCGTLWRTFFEADFSETLKLLGERMDDYPLIKTREAGFPIVDDKTLGKLSRVGRLSNLLGEAKRHPGRNQAIRQGNASELLRKLEVHASGSEAAEARTLRPEDVAACYRVFFGQETANESAVAAEMEKNANLEQFLRRIVVAPKFVWAAQRCLLALQQGKLMRGKVDVLGSEDQLNRLAGHMEAVRAKYGQEDPFFNEIKKGKYRAGTIGDQEIDEFYASGASDCNTILDAFARNNLKPNFDGTIMDFGCGLGRIGEHFSTKFNRYIGVDISKPHLSRAERRFLEIGRTNALFRLLSEFADNDESVDAAFSVGLLQHSPPPAIAMFIDRLCKVLRKGGVLYFQVPVGIFNYEFDLENYLSSPPANGRIEMHCIPQRDVYRILEENKCRLIETMPDSRIGRLGLSYTFIAQKET